MTGMTDAEQYRFFAKLTVGDGCFEWTAGRSKGGYGMIKIGGRMVYAHRVAYELFVGPIPSGLQIDHTCRNRACVRPDHMEAVTSRENTLRGESFASRNAAKTHCPRGHQYDKRINRGDRICLRCRADQDRRYYRERVAKAAGHVPADFVPGESH